MIIVIFNTYLSMPDRTDNTPKYIPMHEYIKKLYIDIMLSYFYPLNTRRIIKYFLILLWYNIIISN